LLTTLAVVVAVEMHVLGQQFLVLVAGAVAETHKTIFLVQQKLIRELLALAVAVVVLLLVELVHLLHGYQQVAVVQV
jgi:preprotein translocase subunit SecE